MSTQVEVYAEALKLALLIRAKEHSGSFETKHKIGEGKEVTVTRGPGGQFVSPGESAEDKPKPSFTSRVEDFRKSINNAIAENATKLSDALKSKPVTDFNENLAKHLSDLLGQDAGNVYSSFTSALPDTVDRAGMKMRWATNDITRAVEKFPDVAKGATTDPLLGAKFAGAVAEEFAIAALGAMAICLVQKLPPGLSQTRLEIAAGLNLGLIGAYAGASRVRDIFNKLAEKGAAATRLQKLRKELDKQVGDMKTSDAGETKPQKAMSLSLGVDPKGASKVIEGLKASKIDPDAVSQALDRQMSNRQALDKHSLRERVLELAALRQNPKPTQDDKDSIQWHEGIINSELRYGEALDKVIEADPKDLQQSQESYFRFLSLVDKGDSVSTFREFNFLERGAFNAIAKSQNTQTHLETQDAKIVARVKECVEAAQFFGKLTRQMLDVRVGFVSPDDSTKDIDQDRGYQANFNITGLGESFVHTGLMHDPATLMFHELGHSLEAKLGNSAITHNYAESRATSKEAEPVRDLDKNESYGENELALPSDFAEAYIAKPYQGNSEVVSMATQELANSHALSLKARSDRDHLLFGLYVLDQ